MSILGNFDCCDELEPFVSRCEFFSVSREMAEWLFEELTDRFRFLEALEALCRNSNEQSKTYCDLVGSLVYWQRSETRGGQSVGSAVKKVSIKQTCKKAQKVAVSLASLEGELIEFAPSASAIAEFLLPKGKDQDQLRLFVALIRSNLSALRQTHEAIVAWTSRAEAVNQKSINVPGTQLQVFCRIAANVWQQAGHHVTSGGDSPFAEFLGNTLAASGRAVRSFSHLLQSAIDEQVAVIEGNDVSSLMQKLDAFRHGRTFDVFYRNRSRGGAITRATEIPNGNTDDTDAIDLDEVQGSIL